MQISKSAASRLSINQSVRFFSCALLLATTTAHASLTLQEAEVIALEKDPSHLVSRQKAMSLDEQAVADAQLPDPKLKLGMMNFPTDSFERDQEPMTQLQLGVQQAFPPGDSLKYKSARTQSLANVERSKANSQTLNVLRSVRLAWLETYYWMQAADVIRRSKGLFEQLINITRSRYAAGGKNQQDVIQSELEIEKLADRELGFQSMVEQNMASLARWIGPDMAQQSGLDTLPALPALNDFNQLDEGLKRHPTITEEQEMITADQQSVHLAREAYKPKWMLDLTYGERTGENPNGTDRADFLSAMLLLDLPLFTGNRQDRRLAATEHKVTATQMARDSRYLELQTQLQREYSNWQRLSDRVHLHKNRILPRTKDSAEAALKAYQSRSGDFTNLVKARLAVLNSELDLLKLSVDSMKSQAQLLYLQGGKQ